MGEAAKVTSLEALTIFRNAVLEFCQETRQALVSVNMEARRIVDWVAHDQLHYWKLEIRKRQEKLTQAKGDLFRRQLSRINGMTPDVTEQKEALWIAKRRLEEAEDKVEKCQYWGRQLQQALNDYAGPARQLDTLVEGDPPRAVILLNRIIETLDAYVELAPRSSSDTGAASAPVPVSAATGSPPEGS